MAVHYFKPSKSEITMKNSLQILFLCVFVMIGSAALSAQMSRIKSTIGQTEAESHLRFLTADELRGRNTGTIEHNIAGRYIAEQFRKYGLEPLGDSEGDYKQKVSLYDAFPPSAGSVTIMDMEFDLKTDIGFVNGVNGKAEGPMVYIQDENELESVDLQDKMVVMVVRNARESLTNTSRVEKMKKGGAAGLIEIYGPGQQFPWRAVAGFLNRQKMNVGEIASDDPLPHIWIHDTSETLIQKLKDNNTNPVARISLEGISKKPVDTYNIVGKVEGTDPVLKNEYVVMCAHYDHVGVQNGQGQDSIYNGTRDNGIGTTGLINAAKYFGKNPPKRSIVIIALTAEEKGLLGSQYYTNNPKVPLEETVFALNIDNSGYTDTENITLLDTARTNIDALVYQAAEEAGLGVMGDRIPSQGYYERSDQVSFASKGVPAINFKMSMAAFDERISKYYHQANDEFDSVDHEYVYKYWISYIRSAELIANWDDTPYWMPGDKFEAAGNELYKK